MGEIRAVTFATHDFHAAALFAARSLKTLCNAETLVITPNNFDVIISNKRLSESLQIDFSSRGAGFWRWKPAIIESLLDEMNYGDTLLYFDSRVYFKRKFVTYLARNINHRIMLFECIQKNNEIEKWTDPWVLSHIDSAGVAAQKNMVLAGVIAVPKTNGNMRIIHEWHDLCSNKFLLSPDDNPEYVPQDPCIWHRHDQSLLSVIVRKNEAHFRILPHYLGLKGIVRNLLIFHRFLHPSSAVFIVCFSIFSQIRRVIVDRLPRRFRVKLRYARTKGKISPAESARHLRFF